MSTTYTPPERKSEYVAYTRTPKRIGNADSGEATDFRSSVFMREYPSLLVKEYEEKSGEFHGETIHWGNVKFDAASLNIAGYKNDFGGQVELGGDAAALLAEAFRQKKPVTVAIETIRRGKNKSSGDEIECTDYIHDLRGAQKDGQKGNSNMTGDTCKNRIVGVGVPGRPDQFHFTGELTTDPAEWPSLRANVDHTLPPTGWRVYKGGIIPTGTNTAAAGSVIDVDDLVARVVEAVRPIANGDTSNRPRPPQREAYSVEAKPWEPWNSDGRLNLGGYKVSKERAVFDQAYTLVTSVDETAGVDEAWALVPVLHWMSDTVQATTMGAGAGPNRDAKSHFEASMWVCYVYTTMAETNPAYAFTKEAVSDVPAQQVWAKAVVETASALFQRAAANVTAHLDPDRAAAAQTPTPAPNANSVNKPVRAKQASEEPVEKVETTTLDELATTAANPALRERFEALLRSINQDSFPERFQPLLEAKFGSWQLAKIPHDDFAEALAAWEANTEEFIAAAYAAGTGATTKSGPRG